MFSANSAAKDIKLSAWPRFEHSTPLTPLRYASIKTVSAMFPVAVSFLLSLIYYCSISRALGEAFTYADLSVIAFFCAFMTLWSVLGRIMIGLYYVIFNEHFSV